MRERVSSASPLGIGQFRGHTLRWHKRSKDRSGKCEAEATKRETVVVWGVVFACRASEKSAPFLSISKGWRNNNFPDFVPRFMSGWVDLREHNRRRRLADVEDCASENRPKVA